jgi:hypothetical protein
MTFYTYLYLRDDGTPFYVGKGSGERAFQSRKNHRPPRNSENILLQEFHTEEDAFAAEMFLISYYGRKDINTGILQNRAAGGVGGQLGNVAWNRGKELSPEHRANLKLGQTGKKKRRSPEHSAKISENKKLYWAQQRALRLPLSPRPQTSDSLKKHYASLSEQEKLSMSERQRNGWKRRKAGAHA